MSIFPHFDDGTIEACASAVRRVYIAVPEEFVICNIEIGWIRRPMPLPSVLQQHKTDPVDIREQSCYEVLSRPGGERCSRIWLSTLELLFDFNSSNTIGVGQIAAVRHGVGRMSSMSSGRPAVWMKHPAGTHKDLIIFLNELPPPHP